MPTSCADLQRMGQKISGFFSVKDSKKTMEMVYCDFYPNQNGELLPIRVIITDADFIVLNSTTSMTDKQKWIGYTDVKSAPVYFYVQRNSSFNQVSTPLPFELALVNKGNAMNLTTGKFTAPRSGIYFFSFTGHAKFPTSSSKLYFGCSLYLNKVKIGSSFIQEANTVDDQRDTLTFQSTLNLKSNDQVWVEVWTTMFLHDNDNHYTHFTGFILEEEIENFS
jgi:hypothetical protein